jgi:hypothetical protein
MAHQRPSLFRSLFSPFARALGLNDLLRAPRRSTGRRRFSALERLEERQLLTTTVFVDFGESYARNQLVSVGDLRRDLIGPDIAFGPYQDTDLLQLTPLRSVMNDMAARGQRIDLNDDGRVDSTDWFQLRDTTMALVRRVFEPFDINVEMVSAPSGTGIKQIMARNAGDPSGQFDAYVLATGIYSTVAPNIPAGSLQGWLGIASGVDLIQNLQNVTDETVLVDGEFMLDFAFNNGFNYAVAMAHVIAHEAVHTLGLRHINSGAFLPGALGVDQELLSDSEIIREGGVFGNVNNLSFITRFPLMMGDGNANTAITRNSFEQFANDPDIGLRAGAPQYVTGTGAFDRISITRIDSQTANVSIQAFRDNTFTTAIPVNGSHGYTIDITNGIVIDGGRGLDQITIDALLGVPITIRGGQGFDQLIVNGHTALDVSYTPDGTYQFIPGIESYTNPFLNDRREYVSYSGTVQAGATAIRFTEFDDSGSITLNNFQSLLFNGSEGADNLLIRSAGVGVGEVEGTVSNAAFPNLRFTGVNSVVMHTGFGAVNDKVAIDAASFTGTSIFSMMTGGGNDEVTLRTSTFPSSGLHLDFGAGGDIFNIEGNVNWTLTDTTLNTTTPGLVRMAGIAGETANIKGGAGANVFNVSDWHGSGRLAGEGGNDITFVSRDANFTYGETFLNVSGGGSYTFSQMEHLELLGGASVNTFIDVGWNGRGNLRGLGGNDIIAVSRDAHVQLGNNFYLAGNNVFFGAMGLDSVEIVSITTGNSANQIDVRARTLPAFINGAGGQDTIVHNRDVDFTLSNNLLQTSGAENNFFQLLNIEVAHLSGGAGNNTFNINQWAGSGFVVGAGGDDTFNFGAGNLDTVIGNWNILGGLGADRIVLNDNLNGLPATYVLGQTSAHIAAGGGRRFGALYFDGTSEDLRVNASTAANRFDVTPSSGTRFTLDGNAPAGGAFGDEGLIRTRYVGPTFTVTPIPGGRRYSFISGHRDVIFEETEVFMQAF